MRNISFLLLFVFFISCQVNKKGTSKISQEEKKPLFTINESPVYPEEFIYAFNKSIKNKSDAEDINDYLSLYINFKLKVAAAKNLGLDTLDSYKNELNGYLQDIKKPYLITEKVNEALLTETYNRLQKEVNASHILILLEADASPSDTLKAYNEILRIKNLFTAGTAFTLLAEKYSEDPSAKQNKGDLGWFTAFQMVYPFESAAYNTPVGEISDIIRSQFGYHLVYVNEIRETLGKIKIAHIMLRFPPKATVADSLEVKKKIYDIHNQLIDGQAWFSLATKYSEDLNTKDNGGSLPWFVTGGLPEPLEIAAFKLNQPGQISSPVKSQFGWHIIKLEEKRGMGSLESMRESLSRRIQRDQRAELKTSEVIDVLKAQNNFKKNEAVYTQLRNIKPFEGQAIEEPLKDQTIFIIGNQSYLVKDFLAAIKSTSTFDKAIESYEKEMIIAFEDSHLTEKYPEYRLLAAEYRDGLLLFEIMSMKVWNKVGSDSVGMHAYYSAHQENYTSPNKIRADIFQLGNDSIALIALSQPLNDSLYAISKKIKFEDFNNVIKKTKIGISKPQYIQPFISKEIPIERFNKKKNEIISENEHLIFLEPIYSEEKQIYLQLYKTADKYLKEYYPEINSVKSGVFNAENELSSDQKIQKGIQITSDRDSLFKLINVLEVIPSKQLNFTESKSALISDYQNYLESEWIKQLKAENSVIINQEILEKVKTELEK